MMQAMSARVPPFRAAVVAAVVALAWLGTTPAAHADDRARGGGRGDERRWVQDDARGGRGGDRRSVQDAERRGGRDWQDRREPGRVERGQPPLQREHWGRQPQGHPGGAPVQVQPPHQVRPPVYVEPPVHAAPPVYGQPPVPVRPPQVEPPPWQGRGGDRVERRWTPQAPRLRPGDQLPPEYRQRQFVVNDWRAHRLYAPPPGHQWVQPEPGNYILVGRNGEIVNMLVGQ